MAKSKSLWARGITKFYMLLYLSVISVIFIMPIIMLIIGIGNVTLLGANLYFFEVNLFFALVLMIYTYVTRYMNKNWKIYIYYFILSLAYLLITMIVMMI
ncbi:MAG: hypothetical protein E7Z86_04915 [Methanosphaera stadtmanae]|nr:hypothetical protein [Methanosphaera stadtmanae]